MKRAQGLGGEYDQDPIQLEESGPPQKWEGNTYATCECLAWRGVWNTVEKHRRHNDLGTEQYLGLPYYGKWLLTAVRAMVDKDLITQSELVDKMVEVKKRYE